MKNKLTMLLAAGALVVGAQQAQAISLDFGSLPGASLSFNGSTDSFQFLNNGTGNSFTVNLSDGFGDSVGDVGRIDGTFGIGAININGNVQTATVTSSLGAALVIDDGAGGIFTGLIDWIEIRSELTAGNLNLGGAVNLTSISYTGTEQDLTDLMGLNNEASAVVAFSFLPAPGKTLTQLTEDGKTHTTSFTGDLTSVPDGGATALLLGLGFLGLGAIARRK